MHFALSNRRKLGHVFRLRIIGDKPFPTAFGLSVQEKVKPVGRASQR